MVTSVVCSIDRRVVKSKNQLLVFTGTGDFIERDFCFVVFFFLVALQYSKFYNSEQTKQGEKSLFFI